MSEDVFPQRAASRFSVGSRLAGYRLEERIGRGGVAEVFRALDERLGRQVALKILAPELADEPVFRERFIRESRAAAAIHDPHIIPVFAAGEASRVLFIAMRLVDGGDAGSLVRRAGPLPPDQVAEIVSQVASALDPAHARGLVHRDVKPANMLLDIRPGRPDHVYLSDFGLTKASADSGGLTAAGQFLGTVDYAAPEQHNGQSVDGRTDQYALGCSAFELLCGEPPFRRDQRAAAMLAHLTERPPSATCRLPGLPSEVDRVFARVLAKSPADRYGTCQEFAEALRRALGLQLRQAVDTRVEAPSLAGGASPAEPPSKGRRKPRRLRRRLWVTAGLLYLMAIAVAALLTNSLFGGIFGHRPPVTHRSPQDIYKAMLRQDMQSLDRGLLAYSPISKLKTGASAEFDVVVTDIGRGPQLDVISRVHGLVVYQQDVPTGGIVGVQAVRCQNLTCISESSSAQPVLFRGDSARWVWQITAGLPGPAEIILRADTYDQGSPQTLREEIIPITGLVMPTPAFNQQQSHQKIANLTKSGINLILTLGSIATAIAALGVIIGWLAMKRRKRKHGNQRQTSRTPKRKGKAAQSGRARGTSGKPQKRR